MSEKPKKSKKRIPQWQFLLTWIGGQYAAFFGIGSLGLLLVILMNFLGFTTDWIPNFIVLPLGGMLWGWFSGWVQQWSIRKHFGHQVKGWRTISAILTGIAVSTIVPFVVSLALTQPDLFSGNNIVAMVAVTFMALFGTTGLGQAFLLRKHVKHSWLFFMATLVGGIIFGLPNMGNSSIFVAQIAQLSVTAFAILWLFGMSGTMDAMQSEDEAIQRLTDSESDSDVYEDDYEEEQKQGRKNLWKNLFRRLGFAI